ADPLLELIIWSTQTKIILPLLDKNNESSRNLETDPLYALNKITIPSLLLLGDSDLQVPASSSEQSFNTISSTKKQIITFTKASHNLFLERPEEFQQAVRQFISDSK
ncbi:MAG: alpha/beta fold hydrolase, partial [Brevinema sp.]